MAVSGGLALAWSGSCAVFPDDAVLPGSATLAGSGGDPMPIGAAGAPDMGDGGVASSGGRGGSDSAGASLGGSAGASLGGSAGTSLGGASDGGEGGRAEPTCEDPVDEVVPVLLDTWIDQASPKSSHGSDTALSVVGGGAQRRALLQLTLPVFPQGAALLESSLELYLETNADPTLVERSLALHRLLHPISESKTNWDQFVNGSNGDWATGGGDFAAEAGKLTVPASTTMGALLSDAAPALAPVFASGFEVSLIVRELSVPDSVPAELRFTSRQGAAARAPKLHLRYCPP
jgi:hypothetical protein